MNTQEQPSRRKRKAGRKVLIYLIVLFLLGCSAVGLSWLYKQGELHLPGFSNNSEDIGSPNNISEPSDQIKTGTPSTADKAQSVPQFQDNGITTPATTSLPDFSEETLTDDSGQSDDVSKVEKTELPVEPLSADEQCAQSAGVVRDFFNHLDDKQYIHNFLGQNKSEPYFISLIQKLADNPPVVSRETDDLFTILKNTAHFFRILGSDNITILKSILHEEKPQVENVLAHFYTLSLLNGCAEHEFNLSLPKSALYDYAGFFLNTMGGRLYLFRRDSVSRLSVSYYSILLIENANREGRNLHGIDIKPPIKLLIPEIENSGTQLLMRDTYLEKLYELENRLF